MRLFVNVEYKIEDQLEFIYLTLHNPKLLAKLVWHLLEMGYSVEQKSDNQVSISGEFTSKDIEYFSNMMESDLD